MNEHLIVTVPNPQLFKVTQKVTLFDNALENQTKLMRKFLRQNDGIGLAANQLGFENQICIVEYKDSKDSQNAIPFQIFINPKIVQKSAETEIMDEGCLSVPQIELPVERAAKIKITPGRGKGKEKGFEGHLPGPKQSGLVTSKYKNLVLSVVSALNLRG